MKDTNIGILQYIKSGQIAIDIEISNIKANRDINVRIKKFLMNSPDYQKLFGEIERKKKQLNQATESARKQHLSQELNNLLALEKAFKVDVLHLAGVFSKLEIRTERLRQAMKLFDAGRFKEADAILAEEDLYNDQFNLLILVDYWEAKQDSLLHVVFNQ